MAHWKTDRILRCLRLLLFQDLTCTVRPLFAPPPIRLRLEQKGNQGNEERDSSLMQHRDKARKIRMSARMACAPRLDPEGDH